MMKKRVLNKELEQYMRKELEKKGIPFCIEKDCGVLICSTPLGSREYHRYVEAAMCKRQQGGKRTEVVSLNEMIHRKRAGSFIMLEKDKEKALNMI